MLQLDRESFVVTLECHNLDVLVVALPPICSAPEFLAAWAELSLVTVPLGIYPSGIPVKMDSRGDLVERTPLSTIAICGNEWPRGAGWPASMKLLLASWAEHTLLRRDFSQSRLRFRVAHQCSR